MSRLPAPHPLRASPCRRFASPRPSSSRSHFSPPPSRAADQPASQTFDANGVKIHYLIAGAGEPVVLIHGLDSSAEINWNLTGVLADLAKDHQVVALDMPGHGRSDKPDKEDAYGLQVVEDVVLLHGPPGDQEGPHRRLLAGRDGGRQAEGQAPRPRAVGDGGRHGVVPRGDALQEVWEKLPAREGSRTPAAFMKTVGELAVTEDELKG